MHSSIPPCFLTSYILGLTLTIIENYGIYHDTTDFAYDITLARANLLTNKNSRYNLKVCHPPPPPPLNLHLQPQSIPLLPPQPQSPPLPHPHPLHLHTPHPTHSPSPALHLARHPKTLRHLLQILHPGRGTQDRAAGTRWEFVGDGVGRFCLVLSVEDGKGVGREVWEGWTVGG